MKQGKQAVGKDFIVHSDHAGLNFRTSSFSQGSNCVAVAMREDGSAVIRDSKNRTMQMLAFTKDEWAAFVQGVKHGEFDIK